MSDIIKDVGIVWNRLFDQKGFLGGEISFVLREFEVKRQDTEVDNLFKTVETITDIKETHVDRLKQSIQQTLPQANEDLSQALAVYSRLSDLEEHYSQDTSIQDERRKRKLVWDKFMDEITSKYSEINCQFETRQEELKKHYEELEKKLFTQMQ